MWGTKKETLLWEREDSGMTVQVWEKPECRELRFGNLIMQSVFSRIHPEYLALSYTRFMLLGLLLLPEPRSVLHIGLGGGSLPKWLHREFPQISQTVIERSPAVVEAAYRFFEFPQDDARLQVLQADAVQIIPTPEKRFDLIFLDAFNADGASEEVTRLEFLQDLEKCLNPDGWLLGNIWTMSGDYREQCEDWKAVFAHVLQARANRKGNMILFGNQSPDFPDEQKLRENSKKLEKRHRLEFRKMLQELQAVL